MRKSIEKSCIASLIFNIEQVKDIPKLDSKYFFNNFYKRIIDKINNSEVPNFAIEEIENSIKDTKYENEWLEILSTNPLPSSIAEYYNKQLKIMSIGHRYNLL